MQNLCNFCTFLSDPSVPGALELTTRSSSSFVINWIQQGHFSQFVVTVDYGDNRNVTNDIWTDPSTSSHSNGTSVHCNISGLLVPGGSYNVSVSAVINHLQSNSNHGSFLTSKLFKHFHLFHDFYFIQFHAGILKNVM